MSKNNEYTDERLEVIGAKIEVLIYGEPFTTVCGIYKVEFKYLHKTGKVSEPIVKVTSRLKDRLTGIYLLHDAPAEFTLALGNVAKYLNRVDIGGK